MVLGSHVIFCLYGFWLPNEQRGSWSEFVGAWELLRFGRATKTDTRRSVAGNRFDPARKAAAHAALKYPAVRLNGVQARAIARGFADYVSQSGISVLACAILPQHVHMVIGRHTIHVEQVVNQLKAAATRRLIAEGVHPLAAFGSPPPRCRARGLWKVFLDQQSDIERACGYVDDNPTKEGLPRQHWSMVQPRVEIGLRTNDPNAMGRRRGFPV
jgi:REP element-mobilizing transposase RayT